MVVLANVTLSAMELAFETRLDAAGLSLQLVPRIDLPNATARQLAHLGYWIDVPTSVPARKGYRNQSRQRLTDDVRVTFLYRIKANNQRADRRLAYEIERQIRESITTVAWMQGQSLSIDHAGTARAVFFPSNAEHLSTVIRFSVARDASLGG